MKKLFIILISISSTCFGAITTLKAPFTEVSYEKLLKVQGRVVIPPMVAEDVYLEALSSDCHQFQETLAKYKAQISAEEGVSLVTTPLPYSMKKNYEVEVVFPTMATLRLNDAGEILLQSAGKTPVLDWGAIDFLRDVLNPADGLLLSEETSVIRLRFARRDMFCSFQEGRLELKLERLVYWKLSEIQEKVMTKNLSLLFQSLMPTMKSEKGNMLEAALAGRAIHLTSKLPDFQAEKKFTSVEYIWNLLFENENSMKKSALWRLDSSVFLQNENFILTLQGIK